ncbi:hypothetical protein [Streptosporangium sp. NPDC020145]|uniref:hypothetical protein n=1 Tax=Streptosporangium sp. NPDC020145 TaxID=3154694 RepID=UPI003436ED5F
MRSSTSLRLAALAAAVAGLLALATPPAAMAASSSPGRAAAVDICGHRIENWIPGNFASYHGTLYYPDGSRHYAKVSFIGDRATLQIDGREEALEHYTFDSAAPAFTWSGPAGSRRTVGLPECRNTRVVFARLAVQVGSGTAYGELVPTV